MKTLHLLLAFCVWTATLNAGPGKISRPAAGTPVRKAVCDEMRKYLRYSNQVHRSFGHFLFVVDELAVLGNYCVFAGHAVKPDGSFSDHLPDISYTTFLKKSGNGWEVIADLSRTDVPSAGELREIRKAFPKEIPTAIIPEFWRARLRQ